MHFQCDLLELEEEQVLDYLHFLKSSHNTPSESFFKHTIYGLRYLYRQFGKQALALRMPSIERSKQLPIVLSQTEVKTLIHNTKLLKHRLIIALLYSCGLRNFELCNLKVVDCDLQRGLLHIRKGKGRKDRYVPLGNLLAQGIKKYLEAEKPQVFLFNGNSTTGQPAQYTPRGVQFVLRQARKRSGINKPLTAHSLRHTYATHLLEMGLDIVSLKEALGHSHIQTTMVYLQVARLDRSRLFSPLDRIYNVQA
jgi:site-specific recombinase XerD